MIERMRKEQVQTVGEAALIDLRRIDVAINAIYDDVKKGKLLSIDRLLKLLERRAKMLGYDEQVFNVNVTGIDIESVRKKRWEEIAPSLRDILTDEDQTDLDQDNADETDTNSN
jgi:hypothetical protein